MTSNENHYTHAAEARFTTTHWSVVLAARDKQSSQYRLALENLCRTYWYPLYAFVRRQGYSPEEAKDLTQGFFAQLLEKDWLTKITHQEGRFRNFLIVAMKHFMSNERAREQALKRGGGRRHLRLDMETAETRYRIEPADTTTPEQLYEHQWAVTLLDQVMNTLKDEYKNKGKTTVFESLKHCILRQRSSLAYPDLAQQLDTTEGAARVMVHRLKQRYRELLREHIAQTVATPEDVESEMQHLRQVLAGP